MSDRPGAFNRDVALLSGVMQYAERLGLRKLGSNPARGVSRYAREPQQRFLNAPELKRLHRRLAESDDTYMVAAIRLLIHTGARSSEIANLTWGEISDSRLELKDSKTGPKSILLSRQARVILEGLPRGVSGVSAYGPNRVN
jgi:integrase